MQIGKFKLTALEFGRFKLDGGAMFGVVPRVLWEKYHPTDKRNRIEMALRCLLISFDDRHVLVDTGFGENRTEKFRKIFDFRSSDNYLSDSLAEIGLTKDDITDVILTHLHFDHCGGSTTDKTDNPVPAFKNAKYYIQKRQLDHARSRFERDKASYLPEDFEPIINSNRAEIADGYWQLVPGLDTIICDGHTPGMQLVRVQDEGETLIYAADLIPLASQVPLAWIMGYDLFPVTTLDEKRKLLTEAVRSNWTLMFEHDPNFVTGKVVENDKGFVFKEFADRST